MAHLNYEPQVLVDTSDLTREVWLDWRRKGIGGSDAAAILGVSPFNTARDLYYDKLGIVSATDEEANWVQKEVGHLLEDLVAKIFSKKTGFKIYQIKKMFYHPDYPYMLADLDYFVELPDGKKAILEIKTTNYNATGNWWLDGKEVVPVNYEIQGRHYMAVMNIDRVYYCCLYGNTEDEVIIRHIDRDEMFEQELIFLEGDFWENNVKAKNPPPYLENGELILESLKKHSGNGDADAPCVELDVITSSKLRYLLELKEAKSQSDAVCKRLENEIKRYQGQILDFMGNSCQAKCTIGEFSYDISYKPMYKPTVNKDNLFRMKEQMPEVYDAFVTVTESRRFNIKKSKAA